jgi:hypothetical protein
VASTKDPNADHAASRDGISTIADKSSDDNTAQESRTRKPSIFQKKLEQSIEFAKSFAHKTTMSKRSLLAPIGASVSVGAADSEARVGVQNFRMPTMAVVRGVVSRTKSLATTVGQQLGELNKNATLKSIEPTKSIKYFCDLDETIKIPGCHGNSVLKFDVFDGE